MTTRHETKRHQQRFSNSTSTASGRWECTSASCRRFKTPTHKPNVSNPKPILRTLNQQLWHGQLDSPRAHKAGQCQKKTTKSSRHTCPNKSIDKTHPTSSNQKATITNKQTNKRQRQEPTTAKTLTHTHTHSHTHTHTCMHQKKGMGQSEAGSDHPSGFPARDSEMEMVSISSSPNSGGLRAYRA